MLRVGLWMEKPRSVWLIVLLWVVFCILLIIRINYFYYILQFPYEEPLKPLNYLSFVIGGIVYFIITIILLYLVLYVKKCSWLTNLLFSFYFLLLNGLYFIDSVVFILFYSNHPLYQHYYGIPGYLSNTAANLIMPGLMLLIFILLFRPEVKRYFEFN